MLGRHWDKGLKSFPPCYSQSPLLKDLLPPPLEQKRFETGLKCKHVVNTLYTEASTLRTLMPQKPQRNCTFMNSASGEKSSRVVPHSRVTKVISALVTIGSFRSSAS
jgi:hypothetical protein